MLNEQCTVVVVFNETLNGYCFSARSLKIMIPVDFNVEFMWNIKECGI